MVKKAKSFSEGFRAKRGKSSVKSVVFPKIRAEMSTQEKILFLVKSRKATTLTGIANILGKTKSTISEHLDKLSAEGRIHLHKKGKENIIYFGGFKGAKKKRKR
jgi:uncharacterized membrane protein